MTSRTAHINASLAGSLPAALVAALLGTLADPAATLAQTSPPVTIEVSECIELESDAARLACFESRVDSARQQQDQPQGSGSVAGSGDPRRDQPEQRSARPAAAPPQDQGEIVATIVALEERLPDTYVVTLDNGQIWEQTAQKRYQLQVGLTVRIYPSRWGQSYRLTAESVGNFIQVRRVR